MTQTKTFNEYQKMAAYTAIYPEKGGLLGLIYVALGLSEAGEIQNKIKKILRDNNGVITDGVRAAVAKEIGDSLWYHAMVATELDLSLEEIASDNIKKLLDRKSRGVLKGSGDDR